MSRGYFGLAGGSSGECLGVGALVEGAVELDERTVGGGRWCMSEAWKDARTGEGAADVEADGGGDGEGTETDIRGGSKAIRCLQTALRQRTSERENKQTYYNILYLSDPPRLVVVVVVVGVVVVVVVGVDGQET